MKRRLILILIAVVLVLGYKLILPKTDSFELSDLQEIRQTSDMLFTITIGDNILAFWDNDGIAVDYFKPSLFKWKWIHGASHSGDYEGFSSQYIPKVALKDRAIAFGFIEDVTIDTIKAYTDSGMSTADLKKIDDTMIWYVIFEKEETLVTLKAYSNEELLYERSLDNNWLID